MSDSAGSVDYFGDPIVKFEGLMPLPETIGSNNEGVSLLKANADHSHGIQVGGSTSPWLDLALLNGWVIPFPGTYYNPQCSKLGNIVFLRGMIGLPGGFGTTPPTAAVPVLQLPSGYFTLNAQTTIYGQICAGPNSTGICRLDIGQDGRIWVAAHSLPNAMTWTMIGYVFSVE